MPLVSVNIITHNRANYIGEAIRSVLSQDFKDLELIIIDDASIDNTSDIVKTFLEDERVKYFLLTKQKNIATLRNIALSKSVGEYVAILDSDDFWCDNEKVSKQVDFLEKNKDIVMVGSAAITINSNGQEKNRVIKPITDDAIKKIFLIKNPFFHSSVVYRREVIVNLGGYDENLKYCDDFDLWIRLNEKEKFYNFPDFFIKYREHNDNESVKNFWRAVKEVLFIIKKYRKKNGFGVFVFVKKIFNKIFEF